MNEKEFDRLMPIYTTWREEQEELNKDAEEFGGVMGSTDCGLESVREDFSSKYYADLDPVISFEDMLELEQEYDRLHI